MQAVIGIYLGTHTLHKSVGTEKNERDNELPNLLDFLSDQAVWQKATSHVSGLAKIFG